MLITTPGRARFEALNTSRLVAIGCYCQMRDKSSAVSGDPRLEEAKMPTFSWNASVDASVWFLQWRLCSLRSAQGFERKVKIEGGVNARSQPQHGVRLTQLVISIPRLLEVCCQC